MKNKLLLLVTLVLMLCACDKENLPNNIAKNFDPEFAIALEKLGYIRDAEYITPDDVRNIKNLDVQWRCACLAGFYPWVGVELSSIKGIEYFENLEVLNCSGHNITELNLSNNTKLVDINCLDNSLTTLNLSNHEKLVTLNCSHNPITNLDISSCSELECLHCRDTKLSEIDLSNKRSLKVLDIGFCLLQRLDVSQNKELEQLVYSFNPGLNGVFELKAWFDKDEAAELFEDHNFFEWTFHHYIEGGDPEYIEEYVKVEIIKM
ncbi:MAG: hypothetical protein J6L03_01445 [Bacteroidaceae bacterium]|nr:hypothetical protein [Bacteroidaceae bacterium]